MKALFAAVLAVAVAACSGPPPADTPPRTVLVRSVGEAAALPAIDLYTGEVRARIESDVAFRIGGKLVERRVDTGAMVRRGEVLARLDARDVELAASAAAAQLAAAQADVALARAELTRSEALQAAGFISASALDARRTALAAAEARVRQARAQAATAGNQAAYAEIKAEADAVVVAAPVEAGQVVAAGQPVLRLARPGEREVLIHVPESRVAAFAPGQVARVRPWAQAAREYAGVVREIAPAADAATRSYALRVSVPKADAALPLGATANVVFARTTPAQTLLPLPAVTAIEGRPTVWIVDAASRVRPLAVEIGAMREDGVVIRSGLPAGARVVLAGVHKLVEGESVRAVEEGAPIALDAMR
ncbi:MAG TPA: efflux RND transporter periplasmic adaptor subunit [Rhodocyclaceae bacterium]|nr:efflux RND transporter periplasmic adaptor subunit [Rhodocyclaceae bacterium]